MTIERCAFSVLVYMFLN